MLLLQLALQVLDDISEPALLCSRSQFSPTVRILDLNLEFFVFGLKLGLLLLELQDLIVVVADFGFVEGKISL